MISSSASIAASLFDKHVQKLARIVLAGLEGTTIEPTVKVSETCWAVVRIFAASSSSANADDMTRLVFAEVYRQVLSSRFTPKE